MKCFYHPERDAIGLCKACSKGLCPECGVDLVHGLACRDSDESQVTALRNLVERSERVHAVMPASRFIGPALFCFMGLLFLLNSSEAGLTSFGAVMGIGFMAFGVIIYLFNRRAWGTNEPGAQQRAPADGPPAAHSDRR